MKLDFDEEDIVPEELKALLQKPPKQRRLERELHPDLLQHAVCKRQSKVSARLLIRRALCIISPELQEGLQLDLHKSSRAEVMRKLVPVGASRFKKQSWKTKAAKKDAAKAPYWARGWGGLGGFRIGVADTFSVYFGNMVDAGKAPDWARGWGGLGGLRIGVADT
ncbi:MAG: hypothetical protein GY772_21105, partial [bacterium]|nr:hypothetical protein [bacterium]